REVSCAASAALSCQSSFPLMSPPLLSRSSRVGSASESLIPKAAREGPMPRTATFLEAVPEIMKPPMPTLLPVWTRILVERLSALVGVADAVGVGLAVEVAVGVGLGLAVGEGVGEGLGDGEGLGVGVASSTKTKIGLLVPVMEALTVSVVVIV